MADTNTNDETAEIPVSTPETAPTPEVAKAPIPIRAIAFAPSSQIADIQYDEENMALIVTFIRGGVYRYDQVPADIANGFANAPSAGRYLQTFIKGIYDYEKIG